MVYLLLFIINIWGRGDRGEVCVYFEVGKMSLLRKIIK